MTWQEALDAYVHTIDETDAKVKAGKMTSRQAEADVDRAFAAMRDALGQDA